MTIGIDTLGRITMKKIVPALIFALGAILASQPLRGDIDVPKVARLEGQVVSMRGTVEFTSCALPLLHATTIAQPKLLIPCPPPMCNSGDPPPCP